MTGIAKIDAPGGIRAFDYALDHPAIADWLAAEIGLFDRIQAHLAVSGAHAGKTVVLLPYAQLLNLAQRLWLRHTHAGFVPKFETTSNWSAALGHKASHADIAFDQGLDLLTARTLLAQAGAKALSDMPALLVKVVYQLAPLAAAAGPHGRAQWATDARNALELTQSSVDAWESHIARVGVEWAAASSYASDGLLADSLVAQWDALIVVQGLAADPMAGAFQQAWGAKCVTLPLVASAALQPEAMARVPDLHACRDAEDEAQRATACALQLVAADRYPVAFVSTDRALTRRVRASLEQAGIAIRDENGWKLSTSIAASSVLALLKAADWRASTDAVLNWAKLSPAYAGGLPPLEALLRREQWREWSDVAHRVGVLEDETAIQLCAKLDACRFMLRGRKTLTHWLNALTLALRACGMWDSLVSDETGSELARVLKLLPEQATAWSQLAETALWAQRQLEPTEFTNWVNQCLEAASFRPAYPIDEQVVFLPMSQMLARPFASLVLAGCDEVRLNPAIEPPGFWTQQQRSQLGLPQRAQLQAQLQQSWWHVLRNPNAVVLWRTSDDAGEALMPSALVQILQAHANAGSADDPRVDRYIEALVSQAPTPVGAALPERSLTASAYDDLRTCPYRFFALRLLGLKSVDELDVEVDKRDFGVWLHAVLEKFHASLAEIPVPDTPHRREVLDAMAIAQTASMALPEGEFLPFEASWPTVRDGYLQWLALHEREGFSFASGEAEHTQAIGPHTLTGRIDRTDVQSSGDLWVLDYKTESLGKSRERVKNPFEDTQLAFYAALLPDDSVQGGYLNVGERDGTILVAQKVLVEARDALIAGILHDLGAIRAGATMPALGEGSACDYCNARGLCRKDFWRSA